MATTKRPASASPEGASGTAQKRHAAAVAPMVPRNQGHTNNNDTFTVLSSFMSASINLTKLDLALDRAKENLARANREYANLKSKFPEFPAIKEQKTSAKTRAEREVSTLEMRLEQERFGSKDLIGTLASLIDQRRTTPPTLSSEDKASLGHVKATQDLARDLEQRVQALENKVGVPDASSSESLAERVKTIEENMETKEDDFIAVVKEQITGDLEAQTKDVTELVDEKCDKIVNQLNEFHQEYTTSNEVQHKVSRGVNGCIDRLEVVETSLSEATKCLKTVERQADANQASTSASLDTVANSVQALRQRIDNVENTASGASATDNLVTVEKNVSALQQRMQKMESAANEAITAENLATLEKSVSDLEQRVLKVENEKHSKSTRNGELPGLLSFQQVRYSDSSEGSEDEIQPAANSTRSGHPKGMQLIRGRLEALEHVQSTHSTQINNLTTDDLAKQMVDAYSQLYSQAKAFEITATNIKHYLGQLGHHVGQMGQRVETLSHRVGAHEQAYIKGEGAMKKLGDDFKQIAKGMENLNNRVDTVDSRVDQIDDKTSH